MPDGPPARRKTTDDWDQLRLLATSPQQEADELLHPIPTQARETSVPERTSRRRAARIAAVGMRSLFAEHEVSMG